MPIYEYRCRSCNAEFEEFIRPPRDEEDLTCPQCGSDEVKKGFSLFGTSGLISGSAVPAPAATGPACGPIG